MPLGEPPSCSTGEPLQPAWHSGILSAQQLGDLGSKVMLACSHAVSRAGQGVISTVLSQYLCEVESGGSWLSGEASLWMIARLAPDLRRP